MSCCCSHIITRWNPCCCQPGPTTTSSTTTTTLCPNGELCEEVVDPRCIIYNGPDIPCYGIKTGDSAADILDIIITYFNCLTTTTTTEIPITTTTSTTTTSTSTTSTTTSTSTTTTTIEPTTTTTTTILCNCYTVTATADCYASWINCDGTPGSYNDFGKEPSITICLQEGSLEVTGLFPLCDPTIVNNGPCTGSGDCTTTTTTEATTTTTIPPFSPDSILDLWAWYKGDTEVTGGSQVTSWADQSTNSNDLAVVSTNYPEQVADTVGTLSTQVVKKAVGTNAYLATATNVPNITSSGVTTFMVVKTNSQSSVTGFMLKNTQFDCYVQNTGDMGGKIGSNTTTLLTGAFANNVYTTVRWYGNGVNQEFAYNGAVINTSSDASYSYIAGTLRLFTQNGSFGIDQGDNSYAEVLIYTRALTPTEITDVENYLRNKYNHY